MKTITRFKKASIGLGVGSLLALTIAGVGAADSVTQEITSGSQTASVENLNLGSVSYKHTEQTQSGTMVLTADDSTGTNAGWKVTIQSSDFVWSAGTTSAVSGNNIGAEKFSLVSAAAPIATAGQAVDDVNGPMVPSTSPVGTLDTARSTIQANAGFGNGTYTQALDVSLAIPAQSAAGTYTGTLTTSISAAP